MLFFGSGTIETSESRQVIGKISKKLKGFAASLRMSRLTARIMAIMLFPLAIFLVGLLSIDQYRTTLIQSEFLALERQGFTLARSLALAEANRDRIVARRQLSAETMNHLLPLVGLGSSLRARVFQPNGVLLADTARGGFQRNVDIRRHREESWKSKTHNFLNQAVSNAASLFSPYGELPIYSERNRQRANHYAEVLSALSGEPRRALRVDRDGQLVLSVAVPVQDLRLVRGALMVSVGGGKIERELANVNIVFLKLFVGVLLVTLGLSLYLARSITTPISRLAAAADQLRQSGDMSRRLQRLPHRTDEIGQLSDSLINLTDELQKRVQATAAFAADVSHELKNPLSSLQSATESFSHAKTVGQRKKLLDIILQDVQRLDRLISDISQASRVDEEIMGHNGTLVDFGQLLDNFVQMRSQTHDTVRLVMQRPETPVLVRMNESRIVQVMDNILANAVSFSRENGEIILILCDIGSYAQLDIMDGGIGIPDNKLDQIFDRFYSERPSGETFGQHSGLGLSIARQIVEGHRGTLVASNRPEGGACFSLSLPLAK